MTILSWVKNKIKQRSAWDGAALVAVGLIILLASSLAKLAAVAAIVWGLWTIWEEKDND